MLHERLHGAVDGIRFPIAICHAASDAPSGKRYCEVRNPPRAIGQRPTFCTSKYRWARGKRAAGGSGGSGQM
jgi:hypothetical protein